MLANLTRLGSLFALCVTVLDLVGCAGTTEGLTDRFRLVSQHVLSEIPDRASGLAYDPERKSLFVVVSAPAAIFEYSPDGRFERRIELPGFRDPEGIAYLGRGRFALAEEQSGVVSIVQIGPEDHSVSKAIQTFTLISGRRAGTDGLEGLCYDSEREELYAVKEKNPMRIYRIRLHADEDRHYATEPWNFEAKARRVGDLSGLAVDPSDGTLWFLSEASRCLVRFTREGQELERFSLDPPYAGLESSIPRAEGVTFDDQGQLFIASEPNLLYRFVDGRR